MTQDEIYWIVKKNYEQFKYLLKRLTDIEYSDFLEDHINKVYGTLFFKVKINYNGKELKVEVFPVQPIESVNMTISLEGE